MIEPSEVKAAFKRVESENYSFRAYLKNHADGYELDEQFLTLHNELFSKYDCSKCRNCCKEYSAYFEENELDTVAALLGITETEFRNKYIKESFGEYQLNTKPCCFLMEDNESSGICPVVYEMIERLKQIYGFKGRKRYYR